MRHGACDIIDLSILNTLQRIASKYNKKFSFPSQDHILRLLSKYHQINICRRTLNYRLKRLATCKAITRIRRHYKSKGAGLVMRSTAYYINKRAVRSVKAVLKFGHRFKDLFRVQEVAQYSLKPQKVFRKSFDKGGLPVGKSS